MKKISKIATVIIMIMMIISLLTNVMAADPVKPGDVDATKSDVNVGGITSIGGDIVRVITTIGVVVSIIVLIVLGIKYMMGSAEEKAEYKKTLMPYIIGAGLVFAASGIATVVYNFATGVGSNIPG